MQWCKHGSIVATLTGKHGPSMGNEWGKLRQEDRLQVAEWPLQGCGCVTEGVVGVFERKSLSQP